MFGIGFAELVLVLVVALLVVGPDKLPGLARSIAKAYNELRRTGNDIKRSVTEIDIGDSLAGLDDEQDRRAPATDEAPAKPVKVAKVVKAAKPKPTRPAKAPKRTRAAKGATMNKGKGKGGTDGLG